MPQQYENGNFSVLAHLEKEKKRGRGGGGGKGKGAGGGLKKGGKKKRREEEKEAMARRTHEFQLGTQNASSSGLIHYLRIE